MLNAKMQIYVQEWSSFHDPKALIQYKDVILPV